MSRPDRPPSAAGGEMTQGRDFRRGSRPLAHTEETAGPRPGRAGASRSSQISDLQKNADGSIDLYFGPAAPAGQEANWVPTDARRRFEVMFRLYGPKKALFDKRWRLPDIEKIR